MLWTWGRKYDKCVTQIGLVEERGKEKRKVKGGKNRSEQDNVLCF